MKKNLLNCILFLITLNLFAQKNCEYKIDKNKILQNLNLDSFIQKLKRENFTVYNDKKSIPNNVQKELVCIATEFTIANPKENYQSDCNVLEELPKRQLIFLAKSENILIMTYATGGIGTSTHFLFIQFDSEKIIDLWSGVGIGIIKHKSIEEIAEFISSQRNKKWGLNTNIIII